MRRVSFSVDKRRGAHFGSLLIVCCFVVLGETAQDVVQISGMPTCASCTIELEEVTVVTSPPDIGLTSMDRIALADDGNVWLVPFAVPHAILRYLPDGTQDLRISERGEGPREFTRILKIEAGPEGTLYVFGNRKRNRYSSSGEFLDTRRVPLQLVETDVFPDGSMIANASSHTRERAGYIFHTLGSGADIRRSFGPRTRGFELDGRGTHRKVAVSGEAAFWAAPTNRYEIELWDVSGTRQRRIVRDVEWFEPWTGEYEPPYEQPSVPRLWDISEDDDGFLWVLFILPAENFSPLPRLEDRNPRPLAAYSPSFDIFIEVLDTDAGYVAAQRRLPNTMIRGGFVGGLHLVFTDVDAGGDQIFKVSRLALSGIELR